MTRLLIFKNNPGPYESDYTVLSFPDSQSAANVATALLQSNGGYSVTTEAPEMRPPVFGSQGR
jgi:hypothetical protein